MTHIVLNAIQQMYVMRNFLAASRLYHGFFWVFRCLLLKENGNVMNVGMSGKLKNKQGRGVFLETPPLRSTAAVERNWLM